MNRANLFPVLVLLQVTLEMFQCEIETKVVGGSYAYNAQYPHAVFLHMCCVDDTTCGASLLNQNILLTAAHCVKECEDLDRFNIRAFAGNIDTDSKNGIARDIDTVICHRKYDERTVENDIALLYARKKFPLNNNIKRVFIAKNFYTPKAATVAGWGIVDDETQEVTTRLKSVPQRLRSKETCDLILGNNKPGMFCAGSINSGAPHPAPGDSGSGLITQNYVAIGIVSFRRRRYPSLAIYTNVSYYYQWISDISKLLFCQNKHLL